MMRISVLMHAMRKRAMLIMKAGSGPTAQRAGVNVRITHRGQETPQMMAAIFLATSPSRSRGPGMLSGVAPDGPGDLAVKVYQAGDDL